MSAWQHLVPEARHDAVRAALSCAFGTAVVESATVVTGGASGAQALRVEVAGKTYLMRLEGQRNPWRNPHQYACMRIAADAGVAPALHHVDDATGVAIMDFIAQQPLQQYPGGPVELARALGELAVRLQATSAFPSHMDYRTLVRRLLINLQTRFAPGLLDAHAEGFERICEHLDWDASTHVSSHNDPNPRNVLFDGKRLWLVDWETAYRNDAFVDIAILADNLAPTPELEHALLRAWLRATPSDEQVTRLGAIKALTRLYYAGLLIGLSGPPGEKISDVTALAPQEFQAKIMSGALSPAGVETRIELGKMCLAGFRAAVQSMSFSV